MGYSDNIEDGNGGMRTGTPSVVQHCFTLMKRSLRIEIRRRRLALAKILLGPFLMLLWTMGNFITRTTYTASNSTFNVFPGEDWSYPDSMILGGSRAQLNGLKPFLLNLGVSNVIETGIEDEGPFRVAMIDYFDNSSKNAGIGAFLMPELKFFVYTQSSSLDADPTIVAAQHAINLNLLQQRGAIPAATTQIQRAPEENIPRCVLCEYPYGPLSIII
jgi:hypothetical protein